MTIASETEWKSLLLEVLANLVARKGSAITGAGLNSALLMEARTRGIEPPDLRQRKFKSVLVELADAGRLVFLASGGSDVLVSSLSHADLLTAPEVFATGGRPAIRRDAFTAFTWVGAHAAYYDPATDTFICGQSDSVPEGAIRIPSPDFGKLSERAGEFARRLDPVLHAEAFSALATPKPLTAFASFVRQNGLEAPWHEFRTNAVANDLKRWASENSLSFRSDWLTSAQDGTPARTGSAVTFTGDQVDSASRAQLGALLSGLDKADIARIAVPLDIVLRLLQGAKH